MSWFTIQWLALLFKVYVYVARIYFLQVLQSLDVFQWCRVAWRVFSTWRWWWSSSIRPYPLYTTYIHILYMQAMQRAMTMLLHATRKFFQIGLCCVVLYACIYAFIYSITIYVCMYSITVYMQYYYIHIYVYTVLLYVQ